MISLYNSTRDLRVGRNKPRPHCEARRDCVAAGDKPIKSKLKPFVRRAKAKVTPNEDDFAGLDAWARKLTLEDGRPLSASERREERLAQSLSKKIEPSAS